MGTQNKVKEKLLLQSTVYILAIKTLGGGYSKKTPKARIALQNEILLTGEAWDSKAIQANATELGCTLELDSKTLLLKIPHLLVTGTRKSSQNWTGSSCPYWLTFVEGVKEMSKELFSMVLFSSRLCTTISTVQAIVASLFGAHKLLSY